MATRSCVLPDAGGESPDRFGLLGLYAAGGALGTGELEALDVIGAVGDTDLGLFGRFHAFRDDGLSSVMGVVGDILHNLTPVRIMVDVLDDGDVDFDEVRAYSQQVLLVFTLLKVLNVLMIILLFTYFLQPIETDCGIVSDITSARYRLSERTRNRRLLF